MKKCPTLRHLAKKQKISTLDTHQIMMEENGEGASRITTKKENRVAEFVAVGKAYSTIF